MATLAIALGSIVLYLIAYNTYGRWLSRKVFRLDSQAVVPSVEVNDNQDYVPTARSIVFGHHFTSIAGTGPIVGPALAIMWGWVPALMWVLFGSIFIGAVHDFGTLVVSMRNRGQTVGDIAGRVLSPRVRLLFLTLLLFALWVVLAIFGWVIATVFRMFPESILPVFLQIPIAIWIGLRVHKQGRNLLAPSVIALGLMYATVWLGAACPGMEWTGGWLGTAIQNLNATLASWPVWVWTGILLTYCYFASVMPVWVLLQPRDYINSLQLISSLALIVAGLFAAALLGSGGRELVLVAPAINMHPAGAPAFIPFIFVTIACGAISGFHCLVSSGTSSKQIQCETDAQLVGYGSMLTEGFLATLVIIAVAAGIGLGWPGRFEGALGPELWHQVYANWSGVTSGTAIGAFVVGSANLLEALGVNHVMATALMGVLVASFAGTTLDTATRLQRYVVQELAATFAPKVSASACAACGYDLSFNVAHCPRCKAPASGQAPISHVRTANPLVWMTNKHVATLFAVSSAFLLAQFPRPGEAWSWETIGTGGLILWPLFGATNQLLAGLAFLVVVFWLWRRNMPVWFAIPPMLLMLVMPGWALASDIHRWLTSGEYILGTVALLMLGLQVWMVVEAALMWPRVRGVLEEALPPLKRPVPAPQPAATE